MWTNRLALLATMICAVANVSYTQPHSRGQYLASVFSDLTPAEMKSVQSFLLEKKDFNLVSVVDNLGKNSIFMMELSLPNKEEVLDFLDKDGPKPPREARVVIFFADQAHPNITEYIVGPLPHPYYCKPYTLRGDKTLNFESRPVPIAESRKFSDKLAEVGKEIDHILLESTGYSVNNCSDHCITFSDNAPRGQKSGERRTWLSLQKLVDGNYIQAIGVEILINHRSLDSNEWTVEKVWYNGQYFDSVAEFVRRYERNELKKLELGDDTGRNIYSTYIPRGEYKVGSDIPGPKFCASPDKRYRVLGNYVEYAGWSFAFRSRTSSGLQFLDVKYNDERIVYELSIQEAISFYSGSTPESLQTKYLDSGWAMGSVAYELAKGIDCPETSTYQDVYHFYDTDKPIRYKNALCIFEMPTGIPLRRHYDSDYNGGFNSYAGLENHVLVVRTISTVYNYDYIWDYVFYQNGIVEVKMSATGYVYATFFTPDGINYGNRIQQNIIGNLHTHLVNYKVDLDVAGAENSFQTLSLRYENISNPWSPGDYIVQSRLVHTQRSTEKQASFRFGLPLPRHLIFQNPNKKNKWGHPRSYRIQYNSHADSVLPRGWKEEPSISWSRYSLAVSRYRDAETRSSNIFLQCDPWDPSVYFENFLRNNEDIVNKDLVAWVTVGFLHVPHAEDIPNTATPGNSVGFFLRPYNFFDEDPSTASRSTVIVKPAKKDFSEVKIQRWTPTLTGQCVSDVSFHYNGTYLPD
uniref:Amine oxidase n=1 Tax=Leptobrachium leishanense TaxID=445787 RepID=A0A8C5PIG6_9ANUR